MNYQKYPVRTLFISLLILVFGLSACSSERSVVTESGSGSKTVPAAAVQPTVQPSVTPAEADAKPSATPNELLRRAQAQPGVPVTVPESMRRPLNPEEMQRALQQMPPEVRDRILKGQPNLAKPTPKKQ